MRADDAEFGFGTCAVNFEHNARGTGAPFLTTVRRINPRPHDFRKLLSLPPNRVPPAGRIVDVVLRRINVSVAEVFVGLTHRPSPPRERADPHHEHPSPRQRAHMMASVVTEVTASGEHASRIGASCREVFPRYPLATEACEQNGGWKNAVRFETPCQPSCIQGFPAHSPRAPSPCYAIRKECAQSASKCSSQKTTLRSPSRRTPRVRSPSP